MTDIDTIISKQDLPSLIKYAMVQTRPTTQADYDRLMQCVITDWVAGFEVYRSWFQVFTDEQILDYVDAAWDYTSISLLRWFIRHSTIDWTGFLLTKRLTLRPLCLDVILTDAAIDPVFYRQAQVDTESRGGPVIEALLTYHEVIPTDQIYD